MNADAARFRAFVAAMPDVEEREHMGIASFRLDGKIMAQLNTDETVMLVKLPLAEQTACVAREPARFTNPPHWGRFGWTYVQLTGTTDAEVRALLATSYRLIARNRRETTL